jgi:Zn-dependent protease
MGNDSLVNLCGYLMGIYILFTYWGYLQEKMTSTTYQSYSDPSKTYEWKYPLILNTIMAFSAYVVALAAETVVNPKNSKNTPFFAFMKPAASSALASPIGYAALNYMNFPLMVLTKASKPVPVMLIGMIS